MDDDDGILCLEISFPCALKDSKRVRAMLNKIGYAPPPNILIQASPVACWAAMAPKDFPEEGTQMLYYGPFIRGFEDICNTNICLNPSMTSTKDPCARVF